jgi:UDP-glucuronate decarboxylase
MNSPDDVSGPVNLGNPVECTMFELAQAVVELTGSHSTIAFRARPPDDPERRRPDIALASSLLGWHPATALRDGLARTIAYFNQPEFQQGSGAAQEVANGMLSRPTAQVHDVAGHRH